MLDCYKSVTTSYPVVLTVFTFGRKLLNNGAYNPVSRYRSWLTFEPLSAIP